MDVKGVDNADRTHPLAPADLQRQAGGTEQVAQPRDQVLLSDAAKILS